LFVTNGAALAGNGLIVNSGRNTGKTTALRLLMRLSSSDREFDEFEETVNALTNMARYMIAILLVFLNYYRPIVGVIIRYFFRGKVVVEVPDILNL
jgi:hypothetical protein